ncbi:MAG: glycosyltransferase family 2 protein [Actinomycetia bacterium]|nr:glycosyltransferase family 2 protein [Actinomycetes bacterium]
MQLERIPTVSACIPHRNYFEYLPEALHSLRLQSFSISEIAVVDDNSDNGDWERIKDFADTWPKQAPKLTIRRVENNPMEERSQRIPYIRNQAFLALSAPTPDYIFFPDSDDLWEKDYVKKCIEIMENDATIDIVYPNVVHYQDGGKIKKIAKVPKFDQDRLFRQCYITCCSVMRTEAFLHAGQWPTKYFKKEFVFWNIITRIGHKAAKLPGSHFFYRIHAGQRHSQYNGNGGGKVEKGHRYLAHRYIAERFGLMYK